MEMTEQQEKEYAKGFNAGYQLSKHEPEMLKELLKAKKDNEYFQGLHLGKKQHDKEKMLAQIKQQQQEKQRLKGKGRAK